MVNPVVIGGPTNRSTGQRTRHVGRSRCPVDTPEHVAGTSDVPPELRRATAITGMRDTGAAERDDRRRAA